VPFANNTAERAVRPVKIQQRTSGGAWRTLQGLTDSATVRSYLDTATKWRINALDALEQLNHREGTPLPANPQVSSIARRFGSRFRSWQRGMRDAHCG
jgi:hypothetical protein